MKKYRKTFRFVVTGLVVAALVLTALSLYIFFYEYNLSSLSSFITRDDVVITIDDDAITREKLLAELQLFVPTDIQQENPLSDQDLIRLHLEDFLLIELTRRESRLATRGVSPDSFERHVIYQILPPDPELRQEALGVIAANFAFTREWQKQWAIKPEDIQKYYEEHRQSFQRGERIALAQIILENRNMAEQVYQQIKIEPEVFDYYTQLGQESLEGKSLLGLTHGNLGFIEIERMPDFLKEAVAHLKIGEISRPVQVGDRYAIFKVIDRRPPGIATLDEVEDEIRVKLRDESLKAAVPQWCRVLFRRHEVRIHWEALGLNPEDVVWRWTPEDVVSTLK